MNELPPIVLETLDRLKKLPEFLRLHLVNPRSSIRLLEELDWKSAAVFLLAVDFCSRVIESVLSLSVLGLLVSVFYPFYALAACAVSAAFLWGTLQFLKKDIPYPTAFRFCALLGIHYLVARSILTWPFILLHFPPFWIVLISILPLGYLCYLLYLGLIERFELTRNQAFTVAGVVFLLSGASLVTEFHRAHSGFPIGLPSP